MNSIDEDSIRVVSGLFVDLGYEVSATTNPMDGIDLIAEDEKHRIGIEVKNRPFSHSYYPTMRVDYLKKCEADEYKASGRVDNVLVAQYYQDDYICLGNIDAGEYHKGRGPKSTYFGSREYIDKEFWDIPRQKNFWCARTEYGNDYKIMPND